MTGFITGFKVAEGDGVGVLVALFGDDGALVDMLMVGVPVGALAGVCGVIVGVNVSTPPIYLRDPILGIASLAKFLHPSAAKVARMHGMEPITSSLEPKIPPLKVTTSYPLSMLHIAELNPTKESHSLKQLPAICRNASATRCSQTKADPEGDISST